MFSIIKGAFEKFKSPSNQKNVPQVELRKVRFKEHQAGWVALKNGRPIAELGFIRIDPPFYLFRFTLIGGDPTQKRFFENTAKRKPDPELIFHNHADPNLTVADGPFLATLWPDGVVHLRDFRIAPKAE